jgi:hypothetical protein
MRRLLVPVALAAALVAAGRAAGAIRTFPGCGATLADCLTAAPNGATIRLRTNQLIPVPDFLNVTKALKLEPAKGFHPKIGRTGPTIAILSFSPATGGMSIRRITLRQVSVMIVYDPGTHRTVFEGNTVRLNSGFDGDSALSVSYGLDGRGPITIRGNDISSSGTGLNVSSGGGKVVISGNVLTSPRVGDSQTGLILQAARRTVEAVIASNVIHHVSDCDCGLSNGMTVSTGMDATLNAWIANNTVANIGNDPGGLFKGILVRPPAGPAGHANVRLFNNVVSGVNTGISLESGPGLDVSGNRNDVFASAHPVDLGSHHIGTTLHKNPRFKNANGPNYRLKRSSALANAAESCVPGVALPRGDAAGRFRYFGPGLDLGAYERGSATKGSAKGVSRTGTNAGNRLVGTRGRDVLCGLGGNDRLLGRGAGDFLFGGPGRDLAFGGPGNDRIDVRDGVAGNDRADGGPGQNVCVSDAGDRRLGC